MLNIAICDDDFQERKQLLDGITQYFHEINEKCVLEMHESGKTLLEAANKADNDAVSPVFLLQAGQVYESMNQNDKAVELYNKIKNVYFRSPISQDIDKYIERATK